MEKFSLHGLDCMHLSLHKYVLELLEATSLIGKKPMSASICIGKSLGNFDGVSLANPYEYRKVVDFLTYVIVTRLDTTFSINKLC